MLRHFFLSLLLFTTTVWSNVYASEPSENDVQTVNTTDAGSTCYVDSSQEYEGAYAAEDGEYQLEYGDNIPWGEADYNSANCYWRGCCRYTTPDFFYQPIPCCGPCYTTGGWMPERPPLFRPLIADPRAITYSAGWRFNDQALNVKNVIDVSYFDEFPVYGWCNVWFCGDKLQIDLEGCLWAVFDPCHYSSPLVNADYYVGIPVTWCLGPWSARARIFHISSHVGDEYLLNHPHFVRRNPSAEYLDGFVSYQLNNDIRLCGGLGWIIQQDESFTTGKFYAEGGVEARITSLGWYDRCEHIYGVPFVAMYFRYNRVFNRHFDSTYALGWEVGKTNGLEHRMRIFVAYHDGYSVEGQWSREPTNYFSIRATYGF